jgi:hypothetical protein
VQAAEPAYARLSKTRRHPRLRHQSAPSSEWHQAARREADLPLAEGNKTDERQAQLRAIASDLLYWKGSPKVLCQAQLPKWRGTFKWQIEAKIEALR